MNPWKTLAQHYRNYHAHNEATLRYGGMVGALSFPCFYFFYTQILHQYDSHLFIRILGALLCFALALKNSWPKKLQPYYVGYSYWVILYSLPFFHVFMSLKTQGEMSFLADNFMAVFFMVLLTDWRNTLVMLILGSGAGGLLYFFTTPEPTIPTAYLAQIPTFILIIIGGSLFKFSEKRIETEKKIRAITALAASIAHEIRNPLGQIKYSLDNISHTLPPPGAANSTYPLKTQHLDDLYQHVAVGKLAIKRGLQIISMILDEVKSKSIDANNFTYLQAAEVTKKAINEYSYETEGERSKVRLKIFRDFTFKGEETLYIFILFNLLKNALYYFKQHPSATITISIDNPTITVTDTGPGIHAHRLGQLFESFKTEGKAGGTGLGLSYCKRVMEAFNGNIYCTSEVGKYTKFTLEFPEISQQELEAQEQTVLQRAQSIFKGKRLLVVDDDATLRNTTVQMLSNLDAQIIDEAENGQIALNKCEYTSYDLIVLDLNMPQMDGYAVAEKIRAGVIPHCQFIPIVAYSSEPIYMAQAKIQKVGMNDLINKPCSQLELITALTQALEEAEREKNQEATARALSGKVALLVEDSDYNRFITKNYLEEWGMCVIEAGNGQAALEQLKIHLKIDIVLMDISMPGMDGLETARLIRSQSSTHTNVPIIALTGYSDEASMQAAQQAGMNDFLIKPFESSLLLNKLGTCLSINPSEHYDGFIASQTRKELRLIASSPLNMERPTLDDMPLLNKGRLEEYKRLGLLGHLGNYSEETHALLKQLYASTASKNFDAMHDALHSLLGFNGTAGALALHEFIKYLYQFVLQGQWPREENWLEKIKDLSTRTAQALDAYIDDENLPASEKQLLING